MKFVLYTNSVSAHQIPLAREIVLGVGAENFRYVCENLNASGSNQRVDIREPWITDDVRICEDCDILLVGGLRPVELMERRTTKGLLTLYQTERWFKPIPILSWNYRLRVCLPGSFRMLIPSYRKMANRFVRLFNEKECCKCLAIGPWAKKDMLSLGVRQDKIIDWGYFVAPSTFKKDDKINCPRRPSAISLRSIAPSTPTYSRPLRVLWVGRMIAWKRVDTIIKAVQTLDPESCQLTFVGNGPMRSMLERMAKGASNIVFEDSMPIDRIREEMRQHDMYVLSSNAEEGWGAALNEALSEGLVAIGTYEAGASAALLPKSNLFHSGDWRSLSRLLRDGVPRVSMDEWSPSRAAAKLLTLIKE